MEKSNKFRKELGLGKMVGWIIKARQVENLLLTSKKIVIVLINEYVNSYGARINFSCFPSPTFGSQNLS
jgi:hypothetical protein